MDAEKVAPVDGNPIAPRGHRSAPSTQGPGDWRERPALFSRATCRFLTRRRQSHLLAATNLSNIWRASNGELKSEAPSLNSKDLVSLAVMPFRMLSRQIRRKVRSYLPDRG